MCNCASARRETAKIGANGFLLRCGAEINKYALMTKREVKMAGYWLSSFLNQKLFVYFKSLERKLTVFVAQ